MWLAVLLLGSPLLPGCGEVTCPEPLSNVDGTCLKVEPAPALEVCDGVDNDGDDDIDEYWPELGTPCGESEGECVRGAWACADDGQSVVCEGAVGPAAEVCDGKDNDCNGTPDDGPAEVCDGEDNDCDGFIDEGVLQVRSEVFSDHATVAAVQGGFVVTRQVGNRTRVETYDLSGDRTGAYDAIDSPVAQAAFMASDSLGSRVVALVGERSFHVLDIHVDSELVPVVLEVKALHGDWRQGIDWGIYRPPLHPRVVASSARFVGYRDVVSFALSSFESDSLEGLGDEPTVAAELPFANRFDAAGTFLVWEQADNVRAGWLRDDGTLFVDIDVARGRAPAMAMRSGGPGVAFLQDGSLLLSELNGVALTCRDDGFCADELGVEGQTDTLVPLDLAYDEALDRWFVAVGRTLVVVARGEVGPVVTQRITLDDLGGDTRRLDLAVSGGTAAVVHADETSDSALTYLGCF